jgi:cytochrome P450
LIQYSKKDQSCIISTFNGEDIILPSQSISWIINQPDDVLSVDLTHKEQLQTDYTFVHPFVVDNPLHHETIRCDLTRQLGNLTMDIIDELGEAFDELWGTDTEQWKEVCPFETTMRIIARASNRIFVGLPLCRNQALLEHGMGFASAVPMASIMLRLFPEPLRPIVALLVARPNRRHTNGFAKILRPEIERRQRLLEGRAGDLEKKAGDPEPNDFLQWSIRRARESASPQESDPEIIAERVLAVNFAAIHTSTFSITNAIFDLAAADPSKQYFDQLREEVDSVLAAENGVWTKVGLAKMYKADSTLRESSRINSFLGIGLVRKVRNPKGVTAPNGTFCPYNSYICVPTNGVHNDPSHYPDTMNYDPLRFSVQRTAPPECSEAASHLLRPTGDIQSHKRTPSNSEEYLKKANLSFVTTSPTYHPFGHGRHACPGRFFAANELKLLLAYMVSNYDFEPLETRPLSRWMGTSLVPPLKATIRIRRRK